MTINVTWAGDIIFQPLSTSTWYGSSTQWDWNLVELRWRYGGAVPLLNDSLFWPLVHLQNLAPTSAPVQKDCVKFNQVSPAEVGIVHRFAPRRMDSLNNEERGGPIKRVRGGPSNLRLSATKKIHAMSTWLVWSRCSLPSFANLVLCYIHDGLLCLSHGLGFFFDDGIPLSSSSAKYLTLDLEFVKIVWGLL